MQKAFQVVAFFTAFCCALLGGCGAKHEHQFDAKVLEEKYLKTEATCEMAAQYYYSCSCGAKGEEVFNDGKKLSHDYTAKIEDPQYLKEAANCQHGTVYYTSCSMCGKKYTSNTFTTEGLGEHNYSQENTNAHYLKSEATFEENAVYYKSCICGQRGEETFVGEKLREYTDEEKLEYLPTSLTVTLYDPENCIYGFTYNTRNKPLRPVIQVTEKDELSENGEARIEEYIATETEEFSYTTDDRTFSYYIVKAEVQLEPSTSYTYRAYDKYVDVGTEMATLETKDTKSTAFSFAHVSDSQVSDSTGAYFASVLSQIVGKNDFILHTGDVVETSKYESEWKDMLHSNFKYLSKIPMMAISGNHETTYKNGFHETFKHFNNKIPTQASTKLGYFYSFIYGNAKFIMLNTNDLTGNKLQDEQYNWLLNELQNNDCDWTIVAMHNPMYSIGKYGSDSSKNAICLALRSQLKGIFAEYGVDIVLQGHDHAISRTYPIDGNGNIKSETWETVGDVKYSVDPSGVIYVMNGPAGNQVRGAVEGYAAALYTYAQTSKPCSWAEFEINGNTLTVTVQYTDAGKVYEYQKWGIQKS